MPRTLGALLLSCVALAAASTATAAAPSLNLAKLTTCFQMHSGIPDFTGVRSTAFTFGTDLDPEVVGYVLVAQPHSQLSRVAAIFVSGRKPVLKKRFANAIVSGYTAHRNGIAPRRGAMAAIRRTVVAAIAACTGKARR